MKAAQSNVKRVFKSSYLFSSFIQNGLNDCVLAVCAVAAPLLQYIAVVGAAAVAAAGGKGRVNGKKLLNHFSKVLVMPSTLDFIVTVAQ